jgi:hypothetical protein
MANQRLSVIYKSSANVLMIRQRRTTRRIETLRVCRECCWCQSTPSIFSCPVASQDGRAQLSLPVLRRAGCFSVWFDKRPLRNLVSKRSTRGGAQLTRARKEDGTAREYSALSPSHSVAQLVHPLLSSTSTLRDLRNCNLCLTTREL